MRKEAGMKRRIRILIEEGALALAFLFLCASSPVIFQFLPLGL